MTSSTARPASGGTLLVGMINGGSDLDFCIMAFCGELFDPMSAQLRTIFELHRCCVARTLLSYPGTSVAEGGTDLSPDVAVAMPEVSEDGLSWTFHLREGLRYAPPFEETEITSEDFIRSLTRAFTPSSSDARFTFPEDPIGGYLTTQYLLETIVGAEEYLAGTASQVSGLEAPDPHTLVVHVTEPTGDLPYRVAWSGLVPIPANPDRPNDVLGVAQGHDGDYGRFLVASGPYMVEGAQDLDYAPPADLRTPPAGDRLLSWTLVRNPSWDPSTDPLRPALPDRIVFVSVPQGEQARYLDDGLVDIMVDTAARDDPKLPTLATSIDAIRFLTLNLAMPPFDDAHVRRAINLAIDREMLSDEAATFGVESEPSMHIALDSLEDNLLIDYRPWPVGGDLDRAREEMRASAYDADGDGRCDGAVCEVVIAVRPPGVDDLGPWHNAVSERIAEMLTPIGLRVQIEHPKPNIFATWGAPERHTQMRFDGWIKDFPTASTFFPPLFGSETIGDTNDSMMGASPSVLRRYDYDPEIGVPNVDARVESCLVRSTSAQPSCWASVDQYLTEELAAAVPLFTDTIAWEIGPALTSITIDASTSHPWPAFDHAVIDPDAERILPDESIDDPVPIPDGFYRGEITPQELLAAGGPNDPGFLDDASGTFTMWVSGGRFEWRIRSETAHQAPLVLGTATGDADTVSFDVTGPVFIPVAVHDLPWSMEGDDLLISMPDCSGVRTTEEDLPFVCASLAAQFDDPLERVA